MRRIGWMLVGALAVLAIQAASSAQDRVLELFVSTGDCSKGSIELRLDCLTRKVGQIEARLDGYGEVVPLAQPMVPTPVPPAPAVPPPRQP